MATRVPLVVIALLVASLFPVHAARNVAYRVQFVNGFGCHIVQINLTSPRVKVTPILSLRFPGGAETMSKLCARERPTAAITGTFFSKTTLLPVGDIVIDGRLAHFGGMGSAIAITPDNRVAIDRLPYGRTQNWEPFESVMACGPLLLQAGEVALAPRHERFRDARVLGRASRTAVGLTAANKLLLVATREQVSLYELTAIMRGLGCIDAINLDGGTSTGMYYRGNSVIRPGRGMVNMLAVYESVPPESRACTSAISCDREAIYRYRSRQAFDAYQRAQTPLAQGRLDVAIALLQEAAQLDQVNAAYQVRLAETLLRQGDGQAASVCYSRAGRILLDKGRAGEALERFRTALGLNPNDQLARSSLASAYRALGMEAEAQVAEYQARVRELEDNLVATHRDLVTEMARSAFAAAEQRPPAVLPGPALKGTRSQLAYVDTNLRVRVALPSCWEFVTREDPSALLMRHRFLPYVAHLRAITVPRSIGLERLVALYWEGSFPRDMEQTPVTRGSGAGVIWTTQTNSTVDGITCETRFMLRGDTLWVLSTTTTSALRAQAAPDFRHIADEFTLY